MRTYLLLVLMAAATPIGASAASIYRCTDAKGALVFSQVPCGKDAKEVGESGTVKSTTAQPSEAADKATLAGIDERCETESQHIQTKYNTEFAGANTELSDLHKKLAASRSKSANADEDPAIRRQIDALGERKTELLGAQDRELAALHAKCRAEHDGEAKRQADRNSSRATMAKR